MKKFFYLIIALALSTGNAMAFENEPAEGLSFMGLFGMNVSKLQNNFLEDKAKVGAMLGIRADYVLPKAHGTYLTAGVDWTMKGGKDGNIIIPIDNEAYEGTFKYALHYIEVPVRVGFRYNLNEEIGLYAEVGPYFAVGVGGRHKCSIDADGANVRVAEEGISYNAFKNYDYDPVNNPDRLTYQRWDAGIGFRIGAEYNQRYNVLIGADWGLADIYRTSLRDAYATYWSDYYHQSIRLPKVHNFNFSITVGYRF